MKADDLVKAIVDNYRFSPGTVILRELRIGCGFGANERRIDVWVIRPQGVICPATAYEVKVTRADFRRDIKNHLKHRGARLFSDQFYFVAPKGVIPPDEVPDWAGLEEVEVVSRDRPPQYGGKVYEYALRQKVPAPTRSKDSPSWPFVVSMLRREAIIIPDPEKVG